jgi:polysaccharide chain length determinant protein (PEP-CTERM system associated)
MENIGLKALHVALMVWGRRWYVLFAALGICILGWTAVFMVPSQYQASTRIYVDTDSLLAPLLRGMTADVNLGQQVDMMQRTLLSRPNLENVLRMTDLDLRANTSRDKDGLIASVGDRVAIRSGGRNLFTVNFIDPDPEVAKKVVQALLTIFIESNLGASRQDIQKARRFIDDQVAEYENQLKVMEARMAEFKRIHPGMLAQAGTVAMRVEVARDRLVQIESEIEDAVAKRDSIAKEMKSTPQYLEVDGVPMVVDRSGDPAVVLDKDINEARQRLTQLRFKFTDQHPDVTEAQRYLDELIEQKRAQGAAPAGSRRSGAVAQRVANPLYDQIRLRLIDAESQVQTLERRRATQKIEIARLDDLARTSPEIEAQALGLDRDYSVIKKNYEELLGRRESAKLSQDVDAKADKVQFRVIDPPFVPAEPNFPNRPLLLTGVLLAGLAGGIVVAFIHAQMADAFSSAQQLCDALRLTVIGSVSWVGSASPRHQLREVMSFSGAIVGLLMLYSLLMIAIVMPHPRSLLSLNAQNVRLDDLANGIQRAFDLLRSAF